VLDEPQKHHEYYMIMNRAALIEQIQEARKTLEKLLTLAANQQLSSATDLFPASISRGGVSSDVPNCRKVRQANRAVRHLVISYCRECCFKGDFRQWEHLLRVGE
jgi:hypothetical protein